MAKYQRKSQSFQDLALKRIKKLFIQAEIEYHNDHKLSDRYVDLARKISMKYKVRIPPELKRRFCKHCNSFLVPGKNLRIRIGKSRVIYYCLVCKKFMRFHLNSK